MPSPSIKSKSRPTANGRNSITKPLLSLLDLFRRMAFSPPLLSEREKETLFDWLLESAAFELWTISGRHSARSYVAVERYLRLIKFHVSISATSLKSTHSRSNLKKTSAESILHGKSEPRPRRSSSAS